MAHFTDQNWRSFCLSSESERRVLDAMTTVEGPVLYPDEPRVRTQNLTPAGRAPGADASSRPADPRFSLEDVSMICSSRFQPPFGDLSKRRRIIISRRHPEPRLDGKSIGAKPVALDAKVCTHELQRGLVAPDVEAAIRPQCHVVRMIFGQSLSTDWVLKETTSLPSGAVG